MTVRRRSDVIKAYKWEISVYFDVTGRLKTGQPFFGVDTVMIKGKEKDKDPKPPKH